MAGDLKIRWDNELLEGDLIFENNDLASEDNLITAALISLFSDRRAEDDDVLPDPETGDRRGWWGDLTIPAFPGDQIGSRLWLLERSKTTQEVLTQAEEFVRESLQWMIDDGIAVKLDVEVERQQVNNETLAFKVSIRKTDGTEVALNFDDKWENTINAL